MAALTGMNAAADASGFVAVHPEGTGSPRSWNGGACCGTAASSGTDDVGFVAAIVDQLESELCVDRARVFATGFSNGGFLSHRLGCELADRIAAIAPVSGVLGIDACSPTRPVPVIHIHGTEDLLVPYDGNPYRDYISVADSIAGWVARDGCAGSPAVTFAQGDATCETYSGCAGNADVTLCTIDGGGHQWPGGVSLPGGGHTSTDLDATAAIWDFFAAHPMPGAQ
jgi:polyhydroxybutyrate depolymerase